MNDKSHCSIHPLHIKISFWELIYFNLMNLQLLNNFNCTLDFKMASCN